MMLPGKQCWEPFCSGWNNIPNICSHGQNNAEAPSSSPSPSTGLVIALCGAWLSHRWTQCSLPSPPGCLRHLHMVNPPARIFTKAKERHFSPSELTMALMPRVCSISNRSQKSYTEKFPSQWFPPSGIWKDWVSRGSGATSEFYLNSIFTYASDSQTMDHG